VKGQERDYAFYTVTKVRKLNNVSVWDKINTK